MRCPSCNYDNPVGASFCEECGTKLELNCPACKASVSPGRDSARNVELQLAPGRPLPPRPFLRLNRKSVAQRVANGCTERALRHRPSLLLPKALSCVRIESLSVDFAGRSPYKSGSAGDSQPLIRESPWRHNCHDSPYWALESEVRLHSRIPLWAVSRKHAIARSIP